MEALLSKELFPDVQNIITEDDEPVDNIFSEKQQRLLTESLNTAWNGNGSPFFVAANVGVFYALYEPPIVPDVFLSLDVQPRADWENSNRKTYFCWEFGKPPEVAIEIVSNRKGKELDKKFKDYARTGVWYYIVFDPFGELKREMNGDLVRFYELRHGVYSLMNDFWLESVGLALRLWEGEYEGWQGTWLRWCDEMGNVIPTGKELAVQEKHHAEQEKQRADTAEAKLAALSEKLRALGLDPDASA